ncbi:hypothetical protein, partial [Escherichia coli]|uniref:hypothetical protein n=1 Tax=Escherichia coli TaxID=562 RepID=UPI001BC84BF8
DAFVWCYSDLICMGRGANTTKPVRTGLKKKPALGRLAGMKNDSRDYSSQNGLLCAEQNAPSSYISQLERLIFRFCYLSY